MPAEWQAIRLAGADSRAQRASRKLKNEELLIGSMAASRLRLEIDRVPLWRAVPDGSQDRAEVKQLVEDFARYLYLPRIQTSAVLTEVVVEGVKLLTWAQNAFAYAESYDETARRYRGLNPSLSSPLGTSPAFNELRFSEGRVGHCICETVVRGSIRVFSVLPDRWGSPRAL